MKKSWYCVFVVFSATIAFCAQEHSKVVYRTWKSASKQFSVDATLISADETEVVLRKVDGATISVLLKQLCDTDQEYITNLRNEKVLPVNTSQNSPAKIQTCLQLSKAANSCQTAVEALQLFKLFLTDKTIAQTELTAAKELFSVWQDRAAKDMVRVGTTWVTPETAASSEAQAARLVEEARRLVEADQDDVATQKLLKASKTDPNQIEADYLLGLSYALLKRDPSRAVKHFFECILRRPTHVGALNNCACAEVRLKRYRLATDHWQLAVQVAPASMEVIQNLGRFAGMVDEPDSKISTNLRQEIANLYASVAAANDVLHYDKRIGWLYSPFYDPLYAQERKPVSEEENTLEMKFRICRRSGDTQVDPSRCLQPSGCGTGFFVQANYIVTNRHVVCQSGSWPPADVVKIRLPGGDRKLYSTSIEAISSAPLVDLAVLKVTGLTSKPLPITADLKKGSEASVFGFPNIQFLGPAIVVAGGRVSLLPREHAAFGNMFAMDAAANPGNSGGPVVDQHGNVCGMLTTFVGAKYFDYTAAVTGTDLLAFLRKNVPQFSLIHPGTEKMTPNTITERTGKSTVLVCSYWKPKPASLPESYFASRRKDWWIYEDRWCMTCYGKYKYTVHCPNPMCHNGHITGGSRSTGHINNPVAGHRIDMVVPTKKICPVCHGSAVLERICPDCIRGIDKSLR